MIAYVYSVSKQGEDLFSGKKATDVTCRIARYPRVHSSCSVVRSGHSQHACGSRMVIGSTTAPKELVTHISRFPV